MLFKQIITTTTLLLFMNQNLYGFGRPGRNGSSGRKGPSGRDGRYAEIYLDGSYKSVNSKGEKGGWGSPGMSGQAASSCWFHQSSRDEYGAFGGHGGHGGDGGDGGNGGSVDIFAPSISALKQLQLDNSGGIPGFPGTAGSGARGCYCSPKSWTIQRCYSVTNPDGSMGRQCQNDRYFCHEGRNGQNGHRGRMGRRGQAGRITVYLSDRRPTPSMSRMKIDLAEIDSREFNLGFDLWERRSSAKSYFHSGSKVAGSFSIWLGQKTKRVRIDWLANVPQEDFRGEFITLELNRDGFKYSYPKGAWLKMVYDEKLGVIKVLDAMKWNDALKASWIAQGGSENWLLDGTKNLRKKSGDDTFMKMPGSGSRLTVSANDDVFGIDKYSKGIYQFKDESWSRYSNQYAHRIAASEDKVYIVDTNYNVLVSEMDEEKFEKLHMKAIEISVSRDNQLWVIGQDHYVYRYIDGEFVKYTKKAKRIANNENSVLIVDDNKNVYTLLDEKWEFIDHSVREISISPSGEIKAIGKGYFLMDFNGYYFKPHKK